MKLFRERLSTVERQGITMTSAPLGAVPPDSESERIGECSLITSQGTWVGMV